MARPRLYTPSELYDKVQEYFARISREVELTEEVPSGARDKYGHEIMIHVPVEDDQGNKITARRYAKAPTIGGLCRHLDIHRSTWYAWCSKAEYADYQDVTSWAQDEIQDYLENEMLSREGKNVRGVEFMLQAHYGLSQKYSVQLEQSGSVAGLDMSSMSDDALRRLAEAVGATKEDAT